MRDTKTFVTSREARVHALLDAFFLMELIQTDTWGNQIHKIHKFYTFVSNKQNDAIFLTPNLLRGFGWPLRQKYQYPMPSSPQDADPMNRLTPPQHASGAKGMPVCWIRRREMQWFVTGEKQSHAQKHPIEIHGIMQFA